MIDKRAVHPYHVLRTLRVGTVQGMIHVGAIITDFNSVGSRKRRGAFSQIFSRRRRTRGKCCHIIVFLHSNLNCCHIVGADVVVVFYQSTNSASFLVRDIINGVFAVSSIVIFPFQSPKLILLVSFSSHSALSLTSSSFNSSSSSSSSASGCVDATFPAMNRQSLPSSICSGCAASTSCCSMVVKVISLL